MSHEKTLRGCWTCRLRRKGCDGVLPQCRSCIKLSINCYQSESKPEWMDGGVQETKMAEFIKQQIKNSASGRRERQAQISSVLSGNTTTFLITSQEDFRDNTVATSKPQDQNLSTNSAMLPVTQLPSDSDHTNRVIQDRVNMSRSFAAMNSQSASRNMQAPNTEADAWELEIFMVYLDYVFPFLFPFYQPPLVGTSRAWLLSFINQSDAVRHSVISLSSFFFTVGHKEVFRDELQLCRWTLWNEVSNQAKMAFKMMSRDITQVIPSSESPSIIGQAQTMETIIQLLIFDQFVGGSDGWNTHLTMAIDLFLQIFNESSSLNRNTLGLGCVLERMALPDPRVVGFVKTLWNSYQSAFRFFTAVLIYFDIIASTSLGTEPRLRHLHSEILGELPLHEIGSLLNLSYFIGCCNSVMRVIADTAALCSWKKKSEQTGGESPEDIATRAQPLFKALQQFLDSFTSDPSFSESENDDTWRLQPFYRSKSQITSAGLEDNRTSRIWAHAARIYLSVSVNGWNPLATQVEEDASAIILLLENIDSPSDLHTLSWPICLVGCVAAGPVLDPILESIIDKAEQSQLLSSVREAGRVIKTVRSSNVQVRDFAFCFSVLGRPVLLI